MYNNSLNELKQIEGVEKGKWRLYSEVSIHIVPHTVCLNCLPSSFIEDVRSCIVFNSRKPLCNRRREKLFHRGDIHTLSVLRK